MKPRKPVPKTEEELKAASAADARRYWLRESIDVVNWLERYVADSSDSTIAWYFKPDSPGMFEQG
jgi:hypothetical protein